jgi:fatty acid desaturase
MLWIRLEGIAAIAVHVAINRLFSIPIANHLLTLAGFGFIWSAIQYAHHFGTVRDVYWGARNLKSPWIIDKVWLNHNWHLNHHLRPAVPWLYLPTLFSGEQYEQRGSLTLAYLKMWQGPRFTTERVQSRIAGKTIK